MITSRQENCKPNFQVECAGAAPLRWSSERAVGGALPVYTGGELGLVIIPKSVGVIR